MAESNNEKQQKLQAYLRANKKGPAVKVNATGGRGAKDASKDANLVLKALTENWQTLQQRLKEMPPADQ